MHSIDDFKLGLIMPYLGRYDIALVDNKDRTQKMQNSRVGAKDSCSPSVIVVSEKLLSWQRQRPI